MGNKNRIHTLTNYLIATVWLINGFFCKLLNLVPGHKLIVARILGAGHAGLFTKAIGTSEKPVIQVFSSRYQRLMTDSSTAPRLNTGSQTFLTLMSSQSHYYL